MNETVNPQTGEVTNPQCYAALCDALAAACARVKAAPKDATNSFHHYNYASAECVIRTARDALAESGLSLGPVRAQVDRPGGDGPDILRRTIRITHRPTRTPCHTVCLFPGRWASRIPDPRTRRAGA